MSYEEMDEYLASIGGLNRMYRIDKGPILDSKAFGVAEGWLPLIKSMIEELIELGWNKRLVQSKEKFGGLRFYIETYPEGAEEIIFKYEKLSYETCEMCGEKGTNRKIKGWLYTLCDDHAKEKNEEDEI
jgi:hypothetical protein